MSEPGRLQVRSQAPIHRAAKEQGRVLRWSRRRDLGQVRSPLRQDQRNAFGLCLACVLTTRGFAMSFMSIAKPLAFTLFTDSGSRFDRRVAFRSAREAAFGPPRRSTAGFRRLRWRAQLHQERRNYPVDPYRRQPTCIVTALPWQTQVRNTGARQP